MEMTSILQSKVLLAIIGIAVTGAAGYGIYSYMQADDEPTASDNSQAQNTNNAADQNAANLGDQTVEGDLVEGFPGGEVPLYLGDVVDSKRSTDSLGRPEYNVRIKTTDSFERVDDWTRTSYVNEGWDIRSESKTLLGGTMIVAHSDGFINAISYDEQGDEILINYGISTK